MRLPIPSLLARVALAAFTFAGTSLNAQTSPPYPPWWTTYAGVSGTGTANDYAAANQGQAKNMAVAAVYELDNDLAQFGGAGPTLDTLAATLLTSDTSGAANDYSALNLGQLKSLAKPFYDRLIQLGYTISPVLTGTAYTTGTYPWVGSATPANDYAIANLGQVKQLFSFDVTHRSDPNNPLPDWWQLRNFGHLGVDPAAEAGSDGLSNVQEFLEGGDPDNADNSAVKLRVNVIVQ